jgi:hypothetical protein
MTEIYEFAARLALTGAGDATMRVEIKIGNLQGRVLVQDNSRQSPVWHHDFPTATFTYPVLDTDSITRQSLIGQPREFAAVALLELFRRFEFAATIETIRSWQDELGRR